MKKITFSLLLLVLFAKALRAQTNEEAARKVDALFASYNNQTPGAAVAVVKDGKIIYSKGFGMADLDHDVPITPSTVFNIASVSKQFTAFAVYLLERDGKLGFNDDIRKHLPELPDWGATVRIRHLLAHTGGLRDQAPLLAMAGLNMDGVRKETILKMIARQSGINYAPGTVFNYSNTGYTLLAEIVERVSGQSFADFTRDRIFRPLGMSNTQVCDNHERIVKNKAESYEKTGGTWYHKPLNVSNAGPSNLLTTVEDLAKWTLNFEKPVVGDRKMINAFNEPSRLDDGRKVVLRIIGADTIFHAKGQNVSNYKGVTMMSHGGHAAGFRTYMGRFPGQRFAVIALSNDEHNESLNARWQIADIYLASHMKPEESAPVSAPTASAKPAPFVLQNGKEYEGDYYSADLDTRYTIRLSGEKLVLTHISIPDVAMNPAARDRFTGAGPRTFAFDLEFMRDAAGKINGLLISNFGVKGMKFVRVN